jgi:hypothetical protein
MNIPRVNLMARVGGTREKPAGRYAMASVPLRGHIRIQRSSIAERVRMSLVCTPRKSKKLPPFQPCVARKSCANETTGHLLTAFHLAGAPPRAPPCFLRFGCRHPATKH